ncbi:hypothetical protein V6N13_020487 [Hibiscus sabdariffa]|uniref:Uncharacterized protein n=1 Tax=Hibiscus sabdariffa TaxID=183260 RepID=A0ABR2ETP1_9ROSI
MIVDTRQRKAANNRMGTRTPNNKVPPYGGLTGSQYATLADGNTNSVEELVPSNEAVLDVVRQHVEISAHEAGNKEPTMMSLAVDTRVKLVRERV